MTQLRTQLRTHVEKSKTKVSLFVHQFIRKNHRGKRCIAANRLEKIEGEFVPLYSFN
jgi:hypothetical protein